MDENTMQERIQQAARVLQQARHVIVFTGAGISVESGVPTFRGKGGLWNQYDPSLLEIQNFYRKPELSWQLIKKLFYDPVTDIKPNPAHEVVAWLEQIEIVKAVITQNIDYLHQMAGSQTVYEFHGTLKTLLCKPCDQLYNWPENVDLSTLPPLCPKCQHILKPNFIFFGEAIPEYASYKSFQEAEQADAVLVIGTTGEVMPACHIPIIAHRNGATIIEVNPEPSNYTDSITDIYLPGKAGAVLPLLKSSLDR